MKFSRNKLEKKKLKIQLSIVFIPVDFSNYLTKTNVQDKTNSFKINSCIKKSSATTKHRSKVST